MEPTNVSGIICVRNDKAFAPYNLAGNHLSRKVEEGHDRTAATKIQAALNGIHAAALPIKKAEGIAKPASRPVPAN
eukprot:scaffold181982_cov21-Tisochrysis_lutea.AAC.1